MSERKTADAGATFQELVKIIAQLRDPKTGCPWDIKQTHHSLKPYLIEEAYETLEAIDHEPDKLPGELGDVLLQVLLHSQIAQDDSRFTINDVITTLTTKLISRHPHVFGDASAKSAEEVVQRWESIKRQERAAKSAEDKGGASHLLDSIPRGVPALLHADMIGAKVARVGFDWENVGDIASKVEEELREFLDEQLPTEPDRKKLEEEYGDLLFTLAQIGRKLQFNPEETLRRANAKFTRRFNRVEELAGGDLTSLDRETLEKLWNTVKEEEATGGTIR